MNLKLRVLRCLWLGLFLLRLAPLAADELKVPAYTAYLEPDPEAARFSEQQGITGWKDARQKVIWFGEFKSAGTLKAALTLRLNQGASSSLRLTIAGQSHEAKATGVGRGEITNVDFGEFEIPAAGYQRLTLESLNPTGAEVGAPQELTLSGSAIQDAHFNLKPRRNAASVHLAFPVPDGTKVEWFYEEVTAVDDPVTTFYMACGFRRGYLGMQVNSPKERRIIFSVWDAGTGSTADTRTGVAKEDCVSLIAKGEGVHTSVFGGEGTGGHSHLKYQWKTGEKQKFLVTAVPVDGTFTTYSGYYFHPEKQTWMLISSMKAPKDGGYLKGLHGFSENFGGSTGHLRRKALYGNQWIRTSDGKWIELTKATFSHDQTGKADRLDRFMGVEANQFFLSHGGFVPGRRDFGTPFDRQPNVMSPTIELPKITLE
jgi:hypothetical protein